MYNLFDRILARIPRLKRAYLIEIHFKGGSVATFWTPMFSCSLPSNVKWRRIRNIGPITIDPEQVAAVFVKKTGLIIQSR